MANSCDGRVSPPPRSEIAIEATGDEPLSHALALRALTADGVPFLVGGALALAAYCGIRRPTKDLDVFVREDDVARALAALQRAGFRTETPFPHWLAKGWRGDDFVDVIFSSGNGAAPVDDEWFAHAPRARVLGVPVRLCPVEETLWSKAFVMERERFDGADVAHLLLAQAPTLDWPRLRRRFGEHGRVLLAHLVLFTYVYPEYADRIPRAVLEGLVAELNERPRASAGHVCRGTLLSREQYLPDLACGWEDGRLVPRGTMSAEAVALWTDAIHRR